MKALQTKPLEKILGLLSKYGPFRVGGGIIVLVLLVLITTFFLNQKAIITNIIEEQKQEQIDEHNKNMQIRVNDITPKINAVLLKLLIETNADRVFVIEMHNGSNNPTGLPFVYGEITYEQVMNDSTPMIADEYGNINLSRYQFASHVFRNEIFKGDINDLCKIDQKLGSRMKENSVKYIYMVSITGNNTDIGFLGVTYLDNNISKDQDGKVINTSQKLAILLDLYKNTIN